MATQDDVNAFLNWHAGLSAQQKAAFAQQVNGGYPGTGSQSGIVLPSTPEYATPAPANDRNRITPRVPVTPAPHAVEGPPRLNPTFTLDEGGGPSTSEEDAAAAEAARQRSVLDFVRATYPWADSLGLTEQIVQWVKDGGTADTIVAQTRQSTQYKSRFVGILRADGTMRMNEGSYLAREDDYRQVFHQFGHDTGAFTPSDYKTLFDSEIDPNELNQRFQTYDAIERSGDDVKSAFYVYAGMRLSTDDLYKAVVDPDASQSLQQEYERRVAAQPLDYETWITRATEAGLDGVTRQLQRLQTAGMVGTSAVQQIAQLDPVFARQLMDSLYQASGSAPEGVKLLGLNELQNAFQYALLGSAATSQGLHMPGTERLQALREAGISRAQATDAYGKIATNENYWQGALDRAHLAPMDESDFEKALLLNNGQQSDLLSRAQGFEKSLADQVGFASLRQNKSGRLQQSGLRPVGS